MMEFSYKVGNKVWITIASNVIKNVEIISISEDWIEVIKLPKQH